MVRTPTALGEVLQRAELNPRQLAAAINAWLENRGLGARRIDPTAPYAWVRHGYKPYDPIPAVAAAVLSEHLGYALQVEQLWPARQPVSRPSACDSVGSVR